MSIGVYHRKNGTWEVRATVILADGSKKRRSFYNKSEEGARNFKVVLMGRANTTGGVLYDEDVDEMLAMINRMQNRTNRSDEQQQPPPEGTALADYLDKWLTESVRHWVRASSNAAYSYRISRYVLPAIGTVQLHDLTWEHLQRLYDDLLDSGLSPATVKTVHVVLHKALEQAVR